MFHMPMSSPMMKRILGFLSCACAAVTMNVTHRVTAHCFSIFGFGFIFFVILSMSFGSWRESLSWENKSFADLAGFTYGTLGQYLCVAPMQPRYGGARRRQAEEPPSG